VRREAGRRGDEGGFTLIELLAVISILGVISFTLAEAVILGFKTTDAVTTDITRFVGVQALRSYFTDDVRRAQKVSDPDPAAPACTASPEAFLSLSWTEEDGTLRVVVYSLESESPTIAGERQLVRWSCVATGAPEKRMLAFLEFDPARRLPVLALCDGIPCPSAAAEPAVVTLDILTNRPKDVDETSVELTVRRRAT